MLNVGKTKESYVSLSRSVVVCLHIPSLLMGTTWAIIVTNLSITQVSELKENYDSKGKLNNFTNINQYGCQTEGWEKLNKNLHAFKWEKFTVTERFKWFLCWHFLSLTQIAHSILMWVKQIPILQFEQISIKICIHLTKQMQNLHNYKATYCK